MSASNYHITTTNRHIANASRHITSASRRSRSKEVAPVSLEEASLILGVTPDMVKKVLLQASHKHLCGYIHTPQGKGRVRRVLAVRRSGMHELQEWFTAHPPKSVYTTSQKNVPLVTYASASEIRARFQATPPTLPIENEDGKECDTYESQRQYHDYLYNQEKPILTKQDGKIIGKAFLITLPFLVLATWVGKQPTQSLQWQSGGMFGHKLVLVNSAPTAESYRRVAEAIVTPEERAAHEEEAKKADSQARVMKFNAEGMEAASNNRMDDAVRAFRAAIAESPSEGSLYNNLGVALSRIGTADGLSQAELAFRQAIALAPGNMPAYGNLALVLERLGRSKEALVVREQYKIASKEMQSKEGQSTEMGMSVK
jgi:tetratricopeptide (TPR) repeat protein